MVANTMTGEEHDLDAHRLALARIYGDVVHHDTEQRMPGSPFGLRDRFRAAVPLVAWLMAATIELLAYIEALYQDGVLQLRTEVFEARVALKSTAATQLGTSAGPRNGTCGVPATPTSATSSPPGHSATQTPLLLPPRSLDLPDGLSSKSASGQH